MHLTLTQCDLSRISYRREGNAKQEKKEEKDMAAWWVEDVKSDEVHGDPEGCRQKLKGLEAGRPCEMWRSGWVAEQLGGVGGREGLGRQHQGKPPMA